MSRKAISGWPFWTAAGLLLLLVAFSYYRDNRNYECEGCHSHLVTNQARMGIWTGFSFPLSRLSADDRPSHLYRDYLASTHTHQWRFTQGSPYGVFGWGGCAVGGRKSTGNLDWFYENDPNFRTFVSRKQADGQLARSDFVDACLLEEPSLYTDQGHRTREAAIATEAPEVQRLRRLAVVLEEEFTRR
jgi:hypothetical protein